MSFGIFKCQNIANKMQYSFDSISLLTSDVKSKASKRGNSTKDNVLYSTVLLDEASPAGC